MIVPDDERKTLKKAVLGKVSYEKYMQQLKENLYYECSQAILLLSYKILKCQTKLF